MRVCVTGMGAYCPSGTNVSELMTRVWAGQSAVQVAPGDESLGLSAMALARCPDNLVVLGIEPHLVRGIDRVSLMALLCSLEALQQAEAASPLNRRVMSTVWGSSIGGIATLNDAYVELLVAGRKRVRPTTIPYTMPSAASFHVAHHLGLQGPSMTLTVACASSALAIIQGLRLIKSGETDAVLVGGFESMMAPSVQRAWQMTNTLCSIDESDASKSCKPFSASRTGFALGEGAAALILESEESALARGAAILGYVLGFGHTTDAGHISKPDAVAQVQAIQETLLRAKISAHDVAYINAHGTATSVGDISEGKAIREALGVAATSVPISSTKAVHGHLLGGAGALEAIVTLESLRAGKLPGNPHSSDIDPELTGLFFPQETTTLDREVRIGLSNSFAFGGINVSLALEAVHAA